MSTANLAINSNVTMVRSGCPYTSFSMFIWNADDTVNVVITYIITCVACPFTILLNTLIIVAVAKNQSLQKNSNIILSSLAVADLLVGAVSQPLSIVRGAFYFFHDNPPKFLCTLDVISVFVLYTTCCTSVVHLTLVAWERNARIGEDVNFPSSVSRNRIKVLISASWTSSFIFVAPGVMYLAGVNFKYIMPLDVFLAITIFFLLFLIVYYYVSIYIKTRKLKLDATNLNVSQMAIAKYENQIAVTTGLLTVALLISYTPSIVMFLFGSFSPVLRGSSFFFWAMTLIELNSLTNPLLYSCRNRQMKQVMLKLLRRGPAEISVALPVVRRNAIQPADDNPLQILEFPQG